MTLFAVPANACARVAMARSVKDGEPSIAVPAELTASKSVGKRAKGCTPQAPCYCRRKCRLRLAFREAVAFGNVVQQRA